LSNVVVYSAGWCVGCKVVKKQLSDKNINYIEVDIGSSEGLVLAKQNNIKSIPVVFVNDVKFVGSNPATISAIIKEVLSD
jgi:glutaredoxin